VGRTPKHAVSGRQAEPNALAADRASSPAGVGGGGARERATPAAVTLARAALKDEEALALLYETLDVLRHSDDPFASVHGARWRVIEGWVRARHRHDQQGDRDDVIQETLLAIGRNVVRMDATTPAAAAKWASIILRRKHVDAIRGRMRRSDRDARGGPAGEEELDQIEGPPPPVPPELLEDRHDRIEAVVLAYIEEEVQAPLQRVTRRAQARACLHRLVRDLDIDEVDARLRLPDPISKERLYKWIERGRPTVAAAMRAWTQATPDDDEVRAMAQVVIELVETRRADAGKPRPERRHGGGQP